MEDNSKKSISREELEKQEAERLKKLEEARRELLKDNPGNAGPSEKIDEQDSDGSANAFEKK